jgi:hypothetical protein
LWLKYKTRRERLSISLAENLPNTMADWQIIIEKAGKVRKK